MDKLIEYIDKVEENNTTFAEAIESYFTDHAIYNDDFKRLKFDLEAFKFTDEEFLRHAILRKSPNFSEDDLKIFQNELVDISNRVINSVLDVLGSFESVTQEDLKEKISVITNGNLHRLILMSNVSEKPSVFEFLFLFNDSFKNFLIFEHFINLTFVLNFEKKFDVIERHMHILSNDNFLNFEPFLKNFESHIPLLIAIYDYNYNNFSVGSKLLVQILEKFENNNVNFESLYFDLCILGQEHWNLAFNYFDKISDEVDFKEAVECFFKFAELDKELTNLNLFEQVINQKGPFYASVAMDFYKKDKESLADTFSEILDASIFKIMLKFFKKGFGF